MTSRLIARLTFRRPPPVVGVIRLSGVIGQSGFLRGALNLETLTPILERAFRLPGLEAIALSINSPGGSPAQSALIQRRIRDLAAEREVPIMAFVGDVAASGGYWLACAADEIFVNENSILGSIGVISAGFGFTDAIEKLGIERELFDRLLEFLQTLLIDLFAGNADPTIYRRHSVFDSLEFFLQFLGQIVGHQSLQTKTA